MFRQNQGTRGAISQQIRKGIQAIKDYLCGGLDCGTLWTGVILRHHLVKFRRFTTQMGISFEQQGKWEEAIVTILAHTVQASWTMLAEHERLINAGGGDTGHHGLRPGSPPDCRQTGQCTKPPGWTNISVDQGLRQILNPEKESGNNVQGIRRKQHNIHIQRRLVTSSHIVQYLQAPPPWWMSARL